MRQIIADFRGNPAAADWHFLGSTATNLQALTRVEWGKENWENCRLWQNLITVLQSTAPNCNSTIWVGKRKFKYKLHDLTRVWQLLSGEKKIDDWSFQSRFIVDGPLLINPHQSKPTSFRNIQSCKIELYKKFLWLPDICPIQLSSTERWWWWSKKTGKRNGRKRRPHLEFTLRDWGPKWYIWVAIF